MNAPIAPERAAVVTSDSPGQTRGQAMLRILQANGILLALVVLLVVGFALSRNFLTAGNIANVARQASIAGILGIGMTFVILTAGIDLSVGSVLALPRSGSRRRSSSGAATTPSVSVTSEPSLNAPSIRRRRAASCR